MTFESGDIIVTRSKNRLWNFVPGYWNHAGLYVEIDVDPQADFGFLKENGSDPSRSRTDVMRSTPPAPARGFVVEALPFYGVILIPVDMFLSRKQIYKVLRHRNQNAARTAGRESLLFLGRNYAIFSSKGETCVTLIRKVYEYATHKPIFWTVPDDFFTRLGETNFQVVFDSEKGK